MTTTRPSRWYQVIACHCKNFDPSHIYVCAQGQIAFKNGEKEKWLRLIIRISRKISVTSQTFCNGFLKIFFSYFFYIWKLKWLDCRLRVPIVKTKTTLRIEFNKTCKYWVFANGNTEWIMAQGRNVKWNGWIYYSYLLWFSSVVELYILSFKNSYGNKKET